MVKQVAEPLYKSPPKRIPITAAARYAQQYLQDQVVIISKDSNGLTHVVTYGKSKEDCNLAAESGNTLKKHFLKWPDELCQAKPRRIRD